MIDYEPPRPEWGQEPNTMFDPEPYKTGWTKEEGDARLNKIRAGLKTREAQHYEASHNGLFRDRRKPRGNGTQGEPGLTSL